MIDTNLLRNCLQEIRQSLIPSPASLTSPYAEKLETVNQIMKLYRDGLAAAKPHDDTLLIDFAITFKCNYHCHYCNQGHGKLQGTADDRTVDALIQFLRQTDKKIILQLVGGEPTIHPRFPDLIQAVKAHNHQVQFCTNFYFPFAFWQDLATFLQNNLKRIQISYHPTQVKDQDAFIAKVIDFSRLLGPDTELFVVAVLTEKNFPAIKNIIPVLKEHHITFFLQHETDTQYNFREYPKELADFLQSQPLMPGMEEIEKLSSFGIMCATGHNFCTISPEGNIYRCYRVCSGYYQIGNIASGAAWYDAPMPCLCDKCICTLPFQHGCLDFSRQNIELSRMLLQYSHDPFITGQFRLLTSAMMRPNREPDPQTAATAIRTKYQWQVCENDSLRKFASAPFMQSINDKSVCIDCGANVGTVTTVMAARGATVYAFEPNPLCLKKLQTNCQQYPRVTIFPCGVLDHDGKVKMYHSDLTANDPEFFSQSSSVYAGKDNVNIGNYDEIYCVDLCAFIARLPGNIDILKMDVEGAEFAILNKMITTGIYQKICHILVETHDATIPEIREIACRVRELIKEKQITNINLNWV